MIEFHVAGKPVPKGSIRAFPHRITGRMIALPMGVGLKPWTRAVATAARTAASGRKLEGAVQVWLDFDLPKPKSERAAGRWHIVRPDLDKLIRAVLDGLTEAGVWGDDGQVASLVATKHTSASAGVTVRVRAADVDRWAEIEEALR